MTKQTTTNYTPAKTTKEERALITESFQTILTSLKSEYPITIPYIRRLVTYNSGDCVVSFYDKFFAIYERDDADEVSCAAIGINTAEQGDGAIIVIDCRYLDDDETFLGAVDMFNSMADCSDPAIILEQYMNNGIVDNQALVMSIVGQYAMLPEKVIH